MNIKEAMEEASGELENIYPNGIPRDSAVASLASGILIAKVLESIYDKLEERL